MQVWVTNIIMCTYNLIFKLIVTFLIVYLESPSEDPASRLV